MRTRTTGADLSSAWGLIVAAERSERPEFPNKGKSIRRVGRRKTVAYLIAPTSRTACRRPRAGDCWLKDPIDVLSPDPGFGARGV